MEGLNIEQIELHIVEHCNAWCRDCAHFSSYYTAINGAKEYSAEEYIPWIDKLLISGIGFNTIRVMGGEPFLHSDLEKVVQTLKNRYGVYGIKITTITNGFWLNNIEKWHGLLSVIDGVSFSKYSGIVKKITDYDKKIKEIADRFPTCKVETWNIEVHHNITFSSQPEMRINDNCLCVDCSTLTTEGKLYRCPVAAFARFNPFVTSEFLRAVAQSATYDIGSNKSIREWKIPRVFEACYYCDMWKRNNLREVVFSPEYFSSVAKLIFSPEEFLSIAKGKQ